MNTQTDVKPVCKHRSNEHTNRRQYRQEPNEHTVYTETQTSNLYTNIGQINTQTDVKPVHTNISQTNTQTHAKPVYKHQLNAHIQT